MRLNDEQRGTQVFAGERQPANYQDPRVPDYCGNPLIEALPPILTMEQALNALTRYPQFSPDQRMLETHLREHLISNVQQFFQPLPIHLDLEKRFSRMIRTGYVARNPLATDQWRQLNGRIQAMAGQLPRQRVYRATASGFSIIGIPGGGKTTAVEEVLKLYPQVIDHSVYGDIPFNRTHVVWLKLACPFDGSIKGLCRNFLDAMDQLLGTNYRQDYSFTRGTVDDLLPAMARIASLHCLGVLVIDEIQHLSASKSGGVEKMLNFFVQLVNTIGLPVVLIGTYKALPILTREFRQIRRTCGQGDLIWERMKNDPIWKHFLETLWRYQYTRQEVLLTQELSDALYDECQGICDFAVKMYMLAQARAFAPGSERVTPATIRSVAKDSFKTAQPFLRALRVGNMAELPLLEDVHPIDFNSAIQAQHREAVHIQLNNTQPNSPSPSKPLDVAQGSNSSVSQGLTADVKSPHRIRKKPKVSPAANSLVAISAAGLSKGIAPYDSLKSADCIKSTAEFLEEVA